MLLLLLGSLTGAVRIIENDSDFQCPEGESPVEAYFTYDVDVLGLTDDCDQSEIDEMVEDVVDSVSKMYAKFSEGESEIGETTTCGARNLEGPRSNLRNAADGEQSFPYRRKLGYIYRKCRRCSRSDYERRELGGEETRGLATIGDVEEDLEEAQADLQMAIKEEEAILSSNNSGGGGHGSSPSIEALTKDLRRWLRGYQQEIEFEMQHALNSYGKKCATSASAVKVSVELIEDDSMLPC